MKRFVLTVLTLCGLTLLVGACGPDDPTSDTEATTPGPDPAPGGSGDKYLTVYFSRSGNTRVVAGEINKLAAGNTLEIVPSSPYPVDYDATLARAQREISSIDGNREYPSIATAVEGFDDYDIIFICTPLWYGRMATPVQSFLYSHSEKLAGKRIALAVTSSSTGISSVVSDAQRLCPGSILEEEALWIRAAQLDNTSDMVRSWLGNMNLKPQNVGNFDLSKGKNGEAPTIMLSSGYYMPVVGLGTYSLTGDVCVNAVMSAISNGFRKFDTAYMYNNEEEVGEGIRRSGIPREEIFVCTKLYPNQFADAGNAIETALRKLDLGYIDLMLLHHPGSGEVAAYKAMEKAVEEGKIRSIGLSNYYIREMSEFLPKVSVKPVLVQNEIHPYYQDRDVIDYMHGQGIIVEAWYPLGGRGHTQALFNDPVIAGIARDHGKSPAQVILRWDLQNGVVVIPGSSNPDHQWENISVFDFELSGEEMKRIDALDRNEKHDWY